MDFCDEAQTKDQRNDRKQFKSGSCATQVELLKVFEVHLHSQGSLKSYPAHENWESCTLAWYMIRQSFAFLGFHLFGFGTTLSSHWSILTTIFIHIYTTNLSTFCISSINFSETIDLCCLVVGLDVMKFAGAWEEIKKDCFVMMFNYKSMIYRLGDSGQSCMFPILCVCSEHVSWHIEHTMCMLRTK